MKNPLGQSAVCAITESYIHRAQPGSARRASAAANAAAALAFVCGREGCRGGATAAGKHGAAVAEERLRLYGMVETGESAWREDVRRLRTGIYVP